MLFLVKSHLALHKSGDFGRPTTLKGTVKVCADDDDEIAQTAKVNFEFIYNLKKALSKCLDCYQKTYHSQPDGNIDIS